MRHFRQKMTERYFLDTDGDCNFFVIPVARKDDWYKWVDQDFSIPADSPLWDTIDWDPPEYATALDGYTSFTFTDPKK